MSCLLVKDHAIQLSTFTWSRVVRTVNNCMALFFISSDVRDMIILVNASKSDFLDLIWLLSSDVTAFWLLTFYWNHSQKYKNETRGIKQFDGGKKVHLVLKPAVLNLWNIAKAKLKQYFLTETDSLWITYGCEKPRAYLMQENLPPFLLCSSLFSLFMQYSAFSLHYQHNIRVSEQQAEAFQVQFISSPWPHKAAGLIHLKR